MMVPAMASFSYQSTQSAFTTQATTTDALIVSALITFTAADLTTFGSVTDDEYLDPTLGVEFLAFNSAGATNEAFTVSGGTLDTQDAGSIEVIFPASTYGLAFNFTTTYTYDNLCVDASPSSFSTCDSGGTFITSGGSGFIGALNDNPLATLTTLWLHPASGGNADTDIQSFEIATMGDSSSAPETSTMLSLGIGLILLGALRHWRRVAGRSE